MPFRPKDNYKSCSWTTRIPLQSIRLRFPYLMMGICCCWMFVMWINPPFTAFQCVQCKTTTQINLTRQMLEIAYQLDEAIMRNKPPSAQVMTQIHKLFGHLDSQYKTVTAHTSSKDVCMDSYQGVKRGWVTTKCKYGKPTPDLIEVLLNYPKCEPTKLLQVLQDIRASYPTMTVHVALRNTLHNPCIHVASQFNGKTVILHENTTPGKAWNQMVSMVSTPYLLIGRNLDGFDANFASIARQIRVLGTVKNVKVVGGAFRNQSLHWHVGCLQADIRNYVLTYQNGYLVSRNECMFCDHLLGPFVTRTEFLREVPFNEHLPTEVLFEDWFLQLRYKQAYVMNCPDVMYFASDPETEEKDTDSKFWIPLVREWELNTLTGHSGRKHVFSCEEAKTSCDNIYGKTKYYLIPTCCLKKMAQDLRVINEFFLNRSIPYEVFSGTVLGGVKMADFIPWDLDFDIIYKGTIDWLPLKDMFSKHGLTIGTVNSFGSGFCRLFTSPSVHLAWNFFFEVWPSTNSLGFKMHSEEIGTKINVHGIWVSGPPNPGAYARNRYGREVLKHTHSWRQVSGNLENSEYQAGSFHQCPTPNHHNCLDNFSPDGSLTFKVT